MGGAALHAAAPPQGRSTARAAAQAWLACAALALSGPAFAAEDDEAAAPDEAQAAEPAAAAPDTADGAEAAEPAPAESPPADGGWQSVGVSVDFNSAVETSFSEQATQGEQEALTPGQLQTLMGDVDDAEASAAPRTTIVRDRFGVRPVLGVVGEASNGAVGGNVGGMVTHQWWTLREAVVKPVGESRLWATAPFGGVRGWRVGVDATAGTWIGPVGVLAGPAFRADRLTVTGGPQLWGTTPWVGGSGRLAVKAGKVVPWVSAAPLWDATAFDAGPALELQGGLVLQTSPLSLRLTGGTRTVGDLTVWDAILGLHLRPF